LKLKVPNREPDYIYVGWTNYGCPYWFDEMIRNSPGYGIKELTVVDGKLHDKPGHPGDFLVEEIQKAYEKWVAKKIEELVEKILLT